MTLCECGCGETVKPGNRFIRGHFRYKGKPPTQGPLPLCKCGCGEVVKYIENKFIHFHDRRFYRKPLVQGPLPLCGCGCGRVVTKISNRFIVGHGTRGTGKLRPHKIPNIPTNDTDYCRMCKSTEMLTTHHIVPRKYGVNNDEYNLITLCIDCHDKVEILTTDWIDSGKEYSTRILKRLIVYIW